MLQMLMYVLGTPAGAGPALSLSGEVVSVSTASTPAIAGIRVGANGTIDKREAGVYTQIDASTDWIIPNGDASSSYQVRITAVTFNSGSSFNLVEASPEDVWIDLSAAREWTVRDSLSSSAGLVDVDFTLEIRLGASGPADVSAAYKLVADYEA